MMELKYDWMMKDGYPANKNNYKVFSCFACGGGSTMGYKLSGFDVIGCNEIDPKMNAAYIENHSPKFNYLESIAELKNRSDLPVDLFDLDILDGSPPCSSFSLAGNREKDWGKEKVFSEGQAKQVLDTLFFDFLDLAKKLRPKVVVAENVKGILFGEAKKYVNKILNTFDSIGYYVDYHLLNAANMGIPQKRERVFFTAIRKDLYNGEFSDLFKTTPVINLEFNEPIITYNQIADNNNKGIFDPGKKTRYLYEKTSCGRSFTEANGGSGWFGYKRLSYEDIPSTVLCQDRNRGGDFHPEICRPLTASELCKISSFPLDYKVLKDIDLYRFCGMSVPPLMMAKISKEIQKQWLDKIP